ncbi:MAG: radical SAM protein [Dorea sp.]|nr:radical SAM protein [Dorea sp.]
MYNEYIKIDMERSYAIGKRTLTDPFIILEEGAMLIYDELLKIEKDKFDFEQFCVFFGTKYSAPVDIIQEDVKLVIDALERNELESTVPIITENTYQTAFGYYNRQNKIFKTFIELTYSCNLKCKHCYLGTDINSFKTKMNYEVVKDVLNQLHDAGCIETTFTGGECFKNPDALKIIKYACEKGFIVSVLTNGTLLTEKECCELVELPISEVRISLYGLETSHDEFVGVEGSFDKSVKTLSRLNYYRPGIAMASTVITRNNYQDVVELYEFLKNKKIRHKITPLIYPTTKGDLSPTKLRVTSSQLNELFKKGLINAQKTMCAAGRARLRIDPNGNINPCELFRDICFGNILEQRLDEILDSSTRKTWIRKLNQELERSECNKCNKNALCPQCIGVGYLENGNFHDKPTAICHIVNAKICSEEDKV